MKKLLLLPHDYFAACLHRLEETRGHILSEDEYRALRQETLNELATIVRRPATTAAGIATAVLGILSGAVIMAFPNTNPLWLAALAAGTAICAAVFAAKIRRRKQAPAWSAEQRLIMLDALLDRRLVTAEEFSRLSERIELPRAA